MPSPTPSASASEESLLLVLTTAPNEEAAAALARTLVSERLAACVNLVPSVRSIYQWQNALCDEHEILCLIKTTSALGDALRQRLTAIHPYEVPEVVALGAAEASRAYLAWVRDWVQLPKP